MRNKKKEINLPNSGIKNNINITLQSRINVSFLLLMFLMIWVLLNNAVVFAYMRRKGYKVTYVVL